MITLSDKPKLQIERGIYTIAGICKNSGKTSLLNWLLAKTGSHAIGVLTTGREGEETDLVYGNAKPSVCLKANTLFTATSDVVNKHGSGVEIITKLAYQAGTKQLWLLRALRDMETEIVGPANVKAQIQTAELMQAKGCEIVFIDGSLDRKSIALNSGVKGMFLMAGGSFGSLDKISLELHKLIQLSQIPQYPDAGTRPDESEIAFYNKGIWTNSGYNSILGNEQELMNTIAEIKPEMLYFPGALTDSILNEIKPALKDIAVLLIRHPLQMHLNKANSEFMLLAQKLQCLQPLRITAIAVNSWSVKGNHLDSHILRDKTRKQFPMVTVIDICEL